MEEPSFKPGIGFHHRGSDPLGHVAFLNTHTDPGPVLSPYSVPDPVTPQ